MGDPGLVPLGCPDGEKSTHWQASILKSAMILPSSSFDHIKNTEKMDFFPLLWELYYGRSRVGATWVP